jgi:hypothetical protein
MVIEQQEMKQLAKCQSVPNESEKVTLKPYRLIILKRSEGFCLKAV